MTLMRTERTRDLDQSAGFEGEIRDFIRKDVSLSRKPKTEMTTAHNPAQEQIHSALRRVSGASMEEIDRVILELQSVRDMLRSEGERVQRELAGYASLNTAALTAMKIIADSLTQWKAAPSPRQDTH
jgi:hypothetical protein